MSEKLKIMTYREILWKLDIFIDFSIKTQKLVKFQTNIMMTKSLTNLFDQLHFLHITFFELIFWKLFWHVYRSRDFSSSFVVFVSIIFRFQFLLPFLHQIRIKKIVVLKFSPDLSRLLSSSSSSSLRFCDLRFCRFQTSSTSRLNHPNHHRYFGYFQLSTEIGGSSWFCRSRASKKKDALWLLLFTLDTCKDDKQL